MPVTIQNDDDVIHPLPHIVQIIDVDDREDLAMVKEETAEQVEAARDRPHQLRIYLLATHRDNIEPQNLGEFDNICRYCGAKYFIIATLMVKLFYLSCSHYQLN